MKSINEILNKTLSTLQQSDSDSVSDDEKLLATAKIVNALFEDLLDIFHSMKYTHEFQEDLDRIKRNWVITFIQSNFLDVSKFEIGLRKLRVSGSPFLPTAGQFIKLCQPTPEELGAPSLEKAFDEACRLSHPCESNKKWSHPAVRLAAHETGSFFLVSEPTTKTFPLFQVNYLKAIDDFINGKVMDRLAFDNDAQEQETRRKQKIIAEGFETITSPRDHIKLMKSLLR